MSAYKGKGDALECGDYKGLKLSDKIMKMPEKYGSIIWEQVEIHLVQLSFVPCSSTTDAIHIYWQQQKKCQSKENVLFSWKMFGNAFDRVPWDSC